VVSSISRSGAGSLRTGETTLITFTLSKSSSNFVVGDVTVSGGALSSFSGSGTSYTATFTPTANSSGTASISVGANSFTDSVGNGNSASSTLSIAFDTSAPTVSLSGCGTAVTVGSTCTITITLSDDVTDLAIGDFTVTRGELSGLTTSGLSRTVTFKALGVEGGSATVQIPANKMTDAVGNGNTASNTLTVSTSSANGRSVLSSSSSTGVMVADGTAGSGRYVIHTFNADGSWVAPQGVTNVDYLVVGGGASGTRG